MVEEDIRNLNPMTQVPRTYPLSSSSVPAPSPPSEFFAVPGSAAFAVPDSVLTLGFFHAVIRLNQPIFGCLVFSTAVRLRWSKGGQNRSLQNVSNSSSNPILISRTEGASFLYFVEFDLEKSVSPNYLNRYRRHDAVHCLIEFFLALKERFSDFLFSVFT